MEWSRGLLGGGLDAHTHDLSPQQASGRSIWICAFSTLQMAALLCPQQPLLISGHLFSELIHLINAYQMPAWAGAMLGTVTQEENTVSTSQLLIFW